LRDYHPPLISVWARPRYYRPGVPQFAIRWKPDGIEQVLRRGVRVVSRRRFSDAEGWNIHSLALFGSRCGQEVWWESVDGDTKELRQRRAILRCQRSERARLPDSEAGAKRSTQRRAGRYSQSLNRPHRDPRPDDRANFRKLVVRGHLPFRASAPALRSLERWRGTQETIHR